MQMSVYRYGKRMIMLDWTGLDWAGLGPGKNNGGKARLKSFA